jgi:hypothetical protein
MESARDLFEQHLQTMYDGTKRLGDGLQRMARGATRSSSAHRF